MDRSHRRFAQQNCARHAAQIATHECYIRGFDGDICARADGNPHVRLGERRCIIHPVTYHRNMAIARLQRLNCCYFLTWQHFRDHTIHPDFARNRLRGALVVPRDHHDFQAERFQFSNGFARTLFYRICDADHADDHVIRRHCDCCSCLRLQRFNFCQRSRANILRAAHFDPLAVHQPTHAAPGFALEAFRLRQRQTFCFRRFNDRLS